MFQEIPVTEDHIYAFKATGKLTDEDYQKFLPRLTTLNHKYGPLSLFIELEEFKGWEPKAAWDDMHYGLKHDGDFNRIAILGDKAWQHWMIAITNIFTHTQLRFFKRDELSKAWDWLREVDEEVADEDTDEVVLTNDEALLNPSVTLKPYQHILVAIDHSVYSDAALQRAIELAQQYHTKLSLVQAIEPLMLAYADTAMVAPPYSFYGQDQKLFDNAEAALKQLADTLDFPDIQHEVIWGSPKASVLSYAEAQDVDLIVVGSHGHRGIARLLGSTASGIMNSARCDVTVVRIPDSEEFKN